MNKLTKEQLTRIIDSANEVITALAGTNDDIHPDNSKKMCAAWDHLNDYAAPPEVVRAMARQLLASMEQEPVGWMTDVEVDELHRGLAEEAYIYRIADCASTIPLYAAPQLPQPAVPDECPHELVDFCEQVIDSRIAANAKAEELWVACRAAMLPDVQGDNHATD